MIRRACAAGVMLALAACSVAEDASAPPSTVDEQRALAEARAMIPRDEISPSSTSGETPKP